MVKHGHKGLNITRSRASTVQETGEALLEGNQTLEDGDQQFEKLTPRLAPLAAYYRCENNVAPSAIASNFKIQAPPSPPAVIYASLVPGLNARLVVL